MKLASLKNGSRDGQLIIVDKTLKRYIPAGEDIKTFQALLDDYEAKNEIVKSLYKKLCDDPAMGEKFDSTKVESPLPRAYQWLDGSAYVNHVELLRKSRGAEMPESFWTDPLMYQGASDAFIGPSDDILMGSEDWGIDYEAEIAVVTDDVPMGVSTEEASKHIKFVMLVNDVSLRALIPAELKKNFGFIHGKPTTSFSPVALSPEELGDAWRDCRVHLPLRSSINNELWGEPQAGDDMTFNFAQLISHGAKTRFLKAGTIIGSGTISNKDRSVGSSCVAEKRMLEKINQGEVKTPFMSFGDRVKIEMLNPQGESLFGAIDQKIVSYKS